MDRGSGYSVQTLSVLAALCTEPVGWRHGYGIAKETGLKSGSLYLILIRLAERGLAAAAVRANPDLRHHGIRFSWRVFPVSFASSRQHPASVHSNGPGPGAEISRWAQPHCGAELTSPPPMDGTPWSVRHARGPGERPALEIYEAGELVAVMVGTSVAPQLLCGARRASRGGQDFGLAWGRLPADGPAITVTFAAGRLRRMGRRGAASEGIRPEVIDIAGWCWLAVAAGRLDVVLVSHRGTGERLRLRAGAGR